MPLTKDEVLAKIEKGESFEGLEIGWADFSGRVFEKDVNFKQSKFLGKANFKNAVFFGEADFRNVEFAGRAYFVKAKFIKIADFRWARFSEEADFWHAQFSTEANFNGAQFADRVVFDGDYEEGKEIFSENHLTSFAYVIFKKPARVEFRRAKLRQCCFINTDISKADFTEVKWKIKKGVLTQRRIVYDETAVKEKKNYETVEKVYRQLKKNYEDRGSYGEAGDFHYGEMEMLRLSQKGIIKYISLTSFYKYLSGYGERWWLALIWLIFAIFLFFPVLYLKSGLAANYTTALFRSLDISTFQKTEIIETITLWGKLSEVFQRIFIPSQLTLFLLAIRRKFRR